MRQEDNASFSFLCFLVVFLFFLVMPLILITSLLSIGFQVRAECMMRVAVQSVIYNNKFTLLLHKKLIFYLIKLFPLLFNYVIDI